MSNTIFEEFAPSGIRAFFCFLRSVFPLCSKETSLNSHDQPPHHSGFSLLSFFGFGPHLKSIISKFSFLKRFSTFVLMAEKNFISFSFSILFSIEKFYYFESKGRFCNLSSHSHQGFSKQLRPVKCANTNGNVICFYILRHDKIIKGFMKPLHVVEVKVFIEALPSPNFLKSGQKMEAELNFGKFRSHGDREM